MTIPISIRAACASAAAIAAAAAPAAPASAGTILFTADCRAPDGRSGGVCAMPDDGTAAPTLVNEQLNEPDWGPDGRFFVGSTHAVTGELGNLGVVNADGSGYRMILDTPPGTTAHRPEVSPDGRFVAYDRGGAEGVALSLRIVGLDGSGDREVARGGAAQWLPDGSGLLFAGADGELHRVDADGTGDRAITRGGNLVDLALSPDGTQVAFSALTERNTVSLFVMHVDGRGVRRLTRPEGGKDFGPVWAPDARSLLFRREETRLDGPANLYRLEVADPGSARALTASTGFMDAAGPPTWHAPGAATPRAAADTAGPVIVLQGLEQNASASAAAASARRVIARRSRLQFSAFDPSGVRTVTLRVDDRRPRRLRRQSDFKRILRSLPAGRHRFAFRTVDAAGRRRTHVWRVALRAR